MMANDVLRLSQIFGMFGPGAMLDLPDRSVLVSGLDQWDMHVQAIRFSPSKSSAYPNSWKSACAERAALRTARG